MKVFLHVQQINAQNFIPNSTIMFMVIHSVPNLTLQLCIPQQCIMFPLILVQSSDMFYHLTLIASCTMGTGGHYITVTHAGWSISTCITCMIFLLSSFYDIVAMATCTSLQSVQCSKSCPWLLVHYYYIAQPSW